MINDAQNPPPMVAMKSGHENVRFAPNNQSQISFAAANIATTMNGGMKLFGIEKISAMYVPAIKCFNLSVFILLIFNFVDNFRKISAAARNIFENFFNA